MQIKYSKNQLKQTIIAKICCIA